ncbi:DUF6221 family protein [Streptomyces sp. NPDC052225]|uniref:DUF6221 family protein n=1 Tax=Streptomyces sp. NPDC052225 TaxID=3154949 RepID=UPI00342F0907
MSPNQPETPGSHRMDGLARWLTTQLDEDARIVSSWHTLACDIHAYLAGDADSVKATMAMFHDAPGAVCDCEVPARMLREVDAKRRIVARYSDGTEAAERLRPVVRLLALPYADRPGYQEGWRP